MQTISSASPQTDRPTDRPIPSISHDRHSPNDAARPDQSRTRPPGTDGILEWLRNRLLGEAGDRAGSEREESPPLGRQQPAVPAFPGDVKPDGRRRSGNKQEEVGEREYSGSCNEAECRRYCCVILLCFYYWYYYSSRLLCSSLFFPLHIPGFMSHLLRLRHRRHRHRQPGGIGPAPRNLFVLRSIYLFISLIYSFIGLFGSPCLLLPPRFLHPFSRTFARRQHSLTPPASNRSFLTPIYIYTFHSTCSSAATTPPKPSLRLRPRRSYLYLSWSASVHASLLYSTLAYFSISPSVQSQSQNVPTDHPGSYNTRSDQARSDQFTKSTRTLL